MDINAIEFIDQGLEENLDGSRHMKMKVGFWYDEKTKSIHMASQHPEHKFHVSITNEVGSVRYHRTLYKHLKRILQDENAWPEGVE